MSIQRISNKPTAIADSRETGTITIENNSITTVELNYSTCEGLAITKLLPLGGSFTVDDYFGFVYANYKQELPGAVEVTVTKTNKVNDLGCSVDELVDAVEKQTINNTVTSPYTLQQSDSGNVLTFNGAVDAVVNIPDGLDLGTSFIALNLGTGSVVSVLNTDTVRGALTLADADSFISMTLVTPTVWQSSERV